LTSFICLLPAKSGITFGRFVLRKAATCAEIRSGGSGSDWEQQLAMVRTTFDVNT
jgi:hypothetical protein